MWKAFPLVCILLAFSGADASSVILNDVVDDLLVNVRSLILSLGKDQLATPDFKTQWQHKFLFFNIHGNVSCKNGWIKSLTSVKREGNVSLSVEGEKMILKGKLGLKNLQFGYDNCYVESWFNFNNHLDGVVADNALDIAVAMEFEKDHCVAYLDTLEVDDFGGVDIKTGSGLMHKVENLIVNAFIRHYKTNILQMVNEKFHDIAQDVVPKMDICSKFGDIKLLFAQ